MTPWVLPRQAVFGGVAYPIHSDYRDILEIFSYFEDPDLTEQLKWRIALALFYEGEIPQEHLQEAMEYLVEFLKGGRQDTEKPAPKLLDWEQDAGVIVAEVNKVASQEIRALPYVHWWTFLSWFHGIGEGQLSTVVSIRQKRQEGKKLSDWEADYYRRNRALVDLPTKISREEREEKQKLMEQLGLSQDG